MTNWTLPDELKQFLDLYVEAKDDPTARAVVRLGGELDSYPFRLN